MREIFARHQMLPMFINRGDVVTCYDAEDDVYSEFKINGCGLFQSGPFEGYEWFEGVNTETLEVVLIIVE